jgi:hypothetical protein
MESEKGIYFNKLSTGELSSATIQTIIDYLHSQGLQTSPISPELQKKNKYGEKITEHLTRLPHFVVEGNPSWEGLLVGFPGNRAELSTKSVSTPYLRKILYPILDLHHRLQSELNKKLPCIYIVGERFSGVFLRKFELLDEVIPHIIIVTNDLYQCSINKSTPLVTEKTESESWTQMKLCQAMDSPEGLLIPTESGDLRTKFLSYEVTCSEGTENPERLDILGYAEDKGIIAFELKGPGASKVELQNLLLQGIEHRNWLEKNKMAVKLLFDRGPRGERINTRKRVRLLLGFYGDEVPHLFYELRQEAKRRDEYTEIDFVRITKDNDNVLVNMFKNKGQG